ncbi:MAG: hypothetical protein HGA45_25955 [Chloroflexales bacterium]|nr:hypothetical protein [Chloroflexales bacterium]
MHQSSLFWPLSLIAAFGLLIVMLLLGAMPSPLVAQSDECVSNYPTPGPEREDCYRTATAKAVKISNTNTAYAISKSPATNTPGSSAPQAPTSTATLTATETLTATSTAQPATATLGPTSTPTATRQVAAISPSPTATSTLVDRETILCAPGLAVALRGEARPDTALLAYFNGRPVGGALSRSDGDYLILLRVGDERPGIYPVDLRERHSRDLVRRLACEVPGATPTPTQSLVP